MITIAYINMWSPLNAQPEDSQTRWFSNFIKENICKDLVEVSDKDNPDILFCGCHKHHIGLEVVRNTKSRIKIFFSNENLNRFKPYNDITILKNTFDLNLVTNYNDIDNKLCRLPWWLWYYPFYNMNDTENNIITYIEKEHTKNKTNKTQFGTVIARYDWLGHKTIMLNELEQYGRVLCPSKFNNNCPDICLGNKNKIDFLSKTKYNICPENSEYEGYCTEKIFQALESGSVPIYWGICDPEVDILCKNKYCFIKNKDDPQEVKSKIKDVVDNYETYISGNVFLPGADKVMNNYYETLKEHILRLLASKPVSRDQPNLDTSTRLPFTRHVSKPVSRHQPNLDTSTRLPFTRHVSKPVSRDKPNLDTSTRLPFTRHVSKPVSRDKPNLDTSTRLPIRRGRRVIEKGYRRAWQII